MDASHASARLHLQRVKDLIGSWKILTCDFSRRMLQTVIAVHSLYHEVTQHDDAHREAGAARLGALHMEPDSESTCASSTSVPSSDRMPLHRAAEAKPPEWTPRLSAQELLFHSQ